VPVVATENVAICPAATFWLTGCVVIDGAVEGVSVLLVLPSVLVALAPAIPVQPEREMTPKRTNRSAVKLQKLFRP